MSREKEFIMILIIRVESKDNREYSTITSYFLLEYVRAPRLQLCISHLASLVPELLQES